MASTEEIKKELIALRYNPAAVQSKTLDLLGEIDVVDPTNPFVFLMEASSVQASATMIHCEALTRQLYPSMAITEEELYLHMSDKDFVDRFATPATTTFTVLFDKEELKRRAVQGDESGVRKIIIPKNTEYNVGELKFTMQYPIEMRVMDYGGIQVVYNNDTPSPIQTLSDNIADWKTVKIENVEYIKIEIPVNQFNIESTYAQVSKTTPFKETINYSDLYYYARVYMENSGGWTELSTTHTEQVFDINKITVVLTVYDGALKVTIPQYYIDMGMVDGSIRIDLYTTKGPMNVLLSSYAINEFGVNWLDRDLGDNIADETVPLTVFNNMAVYSESVVTGGGDGISFEQLRERVITNSLGDSQLPITESQLNAKLSNKGYESARYIDNVTDRVYLATKRLPIPEISNSISAVGASTTGLQINLEELSTYDGSLLNGDRATITPNNLFELVDGILKPVTNQVRNALTTLSTNEFLEVVNTSNYLFSPFHTVLDASKDYFTTRSYFLDNPTPSYKEFVEENTSSELYISTDTFSISKTNNLFLIQVTTKSGDLIKEMENYRILPVLSFQPDNQRAPVHLEGQLSYVSEDGERTYDFIIDTDLDINEEHKLLVNSFRMFETDVLKYEMSLEPELDLVYYVRGLADNLNQLSYNPNCFLTEAYDYGITHEKLSFKMGTFLDGLWERSRTIIGEESYATYDQDVLSVYESNIYERDDNGQLVINRGPGNEVNYVLLHAKGDPILDESGEQLVKHRAGDVMLDHDNKPVVLNKGLLVRDFDLFLIDGKYKFVNEQNDIEYMKNLPETIVGWLSSDIQEFKNLMLEQTVLYFSPEKTYGKARFTILDSEIASLDLEQSFVVTYYLTDSAFSDEYLRERLKVTAIEIIDNELKQTSIKINELTSKLTTAVGDDVVALEIDGLGGELNLATVSLVDKTDRCSIRKKLVQDLNGLYKVVDDVEVVFIRHQS